MENQTPRRPLKSRTNHWAQRIVAAGFYLGLKPNQVSILSMICSVAAVVFLSLACSPMVATKVLFYILAAFCIQLRLLCNLMDGMLAVEWELKSKHGEIYNELPDRFSDLVILVGLGIALSSFSPCAPTLGWIAGSLALLTAYIRSFGVSIGTKAYFNGPMAKPHRMFIITCGCLGAALLSRYGLDHAALMIALWTVVAGSVVTCMNRLGRIAKELNRVNE